jgi:taurine dioxygenase
MTTSGINALNSMTVVPSGGALGAEIAGLSLAEPLPDDTAAAVRQAFLDHCVLYFRAQNLTEQNQVDFTRYFGKPQIHVRKQSEPATPGIFIVSNVEKNGRPIGALGHGEVKFHSDLAYMPLPGSISMLYASEIPRTGGATQWCSGYAAYAALNDDMKQRLRGMRAVHQHISEELNPSEPTDHPIVCTHSQTGRKALFISPLFTRRIVGLEPQASDELLGTLLAHVTQPRFIWTHQWQQGDLLMWDNRPTMHRREPFPAHLRRVMKRTQIFSDVRPRE